MPNLVGGVMTSVVYCLYRNSEVLRETFNPTGTGELATRCMCVDVLKCTCVPLPPQYPCCVAAYRGTVQRLRHPCSAGGQPEVSCYTPSLVALPHCPLAPLRLSELGSEYELGIKPTRQVRGLHENTEYPPHVHTHTHIHE